MRPFKGIIKRDVRDSKPDWAAFLAEKAPKGAPNVLIVLYDDTGCAAWAPYGGRIRVPTLQRLADNGLTYAQWHTTALCSPTRSCILTGRNHHQNGFASISENATGFPGYCSHLPLENAPMATVLREAGWGTFWVGKNHTTPIDEFTMGAAKKNWPLGQGFDRFYGFFGGETNNWYPDLVEDNHYIDQPYSPQEGYQKTSTGKYQESHGTLELYIDGKKVADSELRTMTGHFSLCGEGLCIGYDSGDAVSSEYQAKFPFTGGTIQKVVFDVADDAEVDIEREIAAAMARD